MIGRIAGKILEKRPPLVLVDVGGVGYEIDVPMSTFYTLPEIGAGTLLHTHLIVREDAHLLFGFATPSEREAFRQLIRVSGVGAKTALAVLSGMSVAELAQAVAGGDLAPLTRVPGIGKKTAERLLLELRGKFAPATGELPASGSAPEHGDIVNALLALGYNDREAARAVKTLDPDVAVPEGIRQALRLLSKA
ncbi:MAG: Holliday junction branch migration protein RuvA [Betaproteobacteria bacterium]|nr:Holliday junction branch migration protein RuvA [Betaproteobacteria bacterium]